MQNEISTTSKKRQEKTRLTLPESALVESATTEKPAFTFTIPAPALAYCAWCQAVVAVVVLASGSEVNLDLEIDRGEPRAVLTSPHTCVESQCFAALDAPAESTWDGAR